MIYIDSFLLYKYLIKLGTTNEKHLIIDLIVIQQAYKYKKIAEVVWIKRDYNLTNSMTKHNRNKALDHIIKSNKLHIKAEEWVECNLMV